MRKITTEEDNKRGRVRRRKISTQSPGGFSFYCWMCPLIVYALLMTFYWYFQRIRTLLDCCLLQLMIFKGASKNEPSHVDYTVTFVMYCLGFVGLEGSSLPFRFLLLWHCRFIWRKIHVFTFTFIGHLNVISWCTYAFYVDVNVLLLLLLQLQLQFQ